MPLLIGGLELQYADLQQHQQINEILPELVRFTAGQKGVLVRKIPAESNFGNYYKCLICNEIVDRSHFHFFKVKSMVDRGVASLEG